jgi:hypothetical protein
MITRRAISGILIRTFLASTCAAAALPAPGPAQLTFQRIFKSSSPEFIKITVRSDTDAASYEIRQLDETPGASPFQVGATLRARMFALADKLHDFQGENLDVHRKIAYLGEKTFRWERDGQVYETKFNYTVNPTAAELLQIFEGLARQQELSDLLKRSLRYDPLGVNDALLQVESDMDRGMLPEPQRLLPLLDQIGGDERIVDIARDRARTLADRIRHPR